MMMSVPRRALAGAALALLAAAALCASPVYASTRQLLQLPITEFPPGCKCDRTLDNSPWRLDYNVEASTPIFGFKRHCFDIRESRCNTNSTCCSTSLGVNKVELDVNSTCKASVKRVTLNNVAYGAWEFNPTLETLRVTRLNLTAATAVTTQVCFFLKVDTACTTMTELCKYGNGACKYSIFNAKRDCCPVGVANPPPPPPPPPPPHLPIVPAFTRAQPPSPTPPSPPSPPRSDFPNCVCDRNPAGARLFLQPAVNITAVEKNLTKLCFNVGIRDVCENPDSACCTFNVHKVEFEADPICAKSLVYSTVDGVRRTRLFQLTPYPAIKVTGLERPFSTVAGMEVCLVMKPDCNSLEALGAFHDGSITVAITNKPGSRPATCCPLSYIAGQP